ncbi:MAG TPA: 4-hydroxyproline epimerase [Pyrinomonadaceae bacterium]|nr:4-hydroxyproline epimerase [Pyrinomonadaceae bacterium]
MEEAAKTLRVIDSHTAGEPTRVVIEGFPDLGSGPMAERRERFRTDFDRLRNAVVNEPRGHSAIVGALLCEPHDPACDAGVIFFNNVGYLNMCGHGTIGLVRTLEFLGRIGPGTVRIESPVGIVEAELETDGHVTLANVPSYRFAKELSVEVSGFGSVTGDIAWGGNWFFLIERHDLAIELANLDQLMTFASAVKGALAASGITGENGAEIDHVELFAKSSTADSRNFVLCPGNEYDRSPCGTGTSAKLACLVADGKIAEGDVWRQESVIGSMFEGSVGLVDGKIIPRIRGTAYVTADIKLILDSDDPFRFGIGA